MKLHPNMAGLLCLMVPALAMAVPPAFKQLGEVRFANTESEAASKLESTDTRVGPGAPGADARYIKTTGELGFTLPVSPDQATYVTLQMWGGDVLNSEIATKEGPITLGAPHVDLWVNDKAVDAQLYDEILGSEPSLPGRYFYRTIRLPLEATKGQSNLKMTLRPSKTVGGAYAKVGGGAPTQVDESVYARGYYQAVTHVGNFLPTDATVPDPKLIPSSEQTNLDFPLIQERLVTAIEVAVENVMQRQLFGPEYDKAAAAGKFPSVVHGLFHKDGLKAYLEVAGPADSDRLTPVTGSGHARSHAGAGFLFVHAYERKGSRYYQNPEMLQRTIALLDGFRRYQGGNGAWEIGGGSNGWIGGPDRKSPNGGLQGFFVSGLANSFLAVWPHVKDSPEVLDAKVDSDGDGNADVTRREAWTAIFREYLQNQLKMPGGVANQARINAIGAAMASQALQTLSPGDTTGAEELKNLVEGSTGLKPHAKGVYMLTKAGISLEGAGFCPAYGQHTNADFPRLMQFTNDPRIQQQFEKSLDLFSHMVFPLNGDRGGELLVSGPMGSRHHEFPGAPLHWTSLVAPAVEMKNPFATYAVDYMLRWSRNLEVSPIPESLGVHLPGATIAAIQLLDRLPAVEARLAEERAAYSLPSASSEFNCKIDGEVGLFALHEKGTSLYVQAVNQGRYHYISDRSQAFGNYEAEEADGIRTIRIGKWFIAQNMTSTPKAGDDGRDVQLSILPAVDEARDMVSGKTVKLNRPLTLKPAESVIFDMQALGNPTLSTVR